MRSRLAFGTRGTLGLIINVPIRDPAIPNPLVTSKEDGCFQPYLTVLRDPQAGRLRADGLKVRFDEWVLPVAASRQSAAFSSDKPGTRKEEDGGALPRRRYAEKIQEGLEHSRVLACPAAASERRRKAGTCGRDNLPFRDPLNKDRRFRAKLRPLAS